MTEASASDAGMASVEVKQESGIDVQADDKPKKAAKTKADRKFFSDHVEASTAVDSKDELARFQQIIDAQGDACTAAIAKKYDADAKRNWDIFYKRNQSNFYKDRHYIQREFSEIERRFDDKRRRTLFETIRIWYGTQFGGSLGSTLTQDFYASDFSPRAVQLIRDRMAEKKIEPERCRLWVYDLTADAFDEQIRPDYITMIFVLSAIRPEKMPAVLKKVIDCMQPGGYLFLRDYALYDMTQLRFKKGQRIADNFYARGDGTQSYFFSTEVMGALLCEAGFEVLSNTYVRKTVRNVKEGKNLRRTWIQVKARKPDTSAGAGSGSGSGSGGSKRTDSSAATVSASGAAGATGAGSGTGVGAGAAVDCKGGSASGTVSAAASAGAGVAVAKASGS